MPLSLASMPSLAPPLPSSLIAADGTPQAADGNGFGALLTAQMAANEAEQESPLDSPEGASALLPIVVDGTIIAAPAPFIPVSTTEAVPLSAINHPANSNLLHPANGRNLPPLAGLPSDNAPTGEWVPHTAQPIPAALPQTSAGALAQAAQAPLPPAKPAVTVHMAAQAPEPMPSPSPSQTPSLVANGPQAVLTADEDAASPASVQTLADLRGKRGGTEGGTRGAARAAADPATTPLEIQQDGLLPRSDRAQAALQISDRSAQPPANAAPAPLNRKNEASSAVRSVKLTPASTAPADGAAVPPLRQDLVSSAAPFMTAPALSAPQEAAPLRAPIAPIAAPLHDLTQILDQLTAARMALLPATATMALQHEDFGTLSLRFDQSRDGQLTAELSAPNAETHRAVALALTAEKTSSAAQDTALRAQNHDHSDTSLARQSGAERDLAHSRQQQQGQPTAQGRSGAPSRHGASQNAAQAAAPQNRTGIFA